MLEDFQQSNTKGVTEEKSYTLDTPITENILKWLLPYLGFFIFWLPNLPHLQYLLDMSVHCKYPETTEEQQFLVLFSKISHQHEMKKKH